MSLLPVNAQLSSGSRVVVKTREKLPCDRLPRCVYLPSIRPPFDLTVLKTDSVVFFLLSTPLFFLFFLLPCMGFALICPLSCCSNKTWCTLHSSHRKRLLPLNLSGILILKWVSKACVGARYCQIMLHVFSRMIPHILAYY